MAALVAPARVACKPLPSLLQDQFDLIGSLVVVPDNRWEEMLELTRETFLLPGRDVTIIETEKGPFAIIMSEDVDRNAPELPDGPIDFIPRAVKRER